MFNHVKQNIRRNDNMKEQVSTLIKPHYSLFIKTCLSEIENIHYII